MTRHAPPAILAVLLLAAGCSVPGGSDNAESSSADGTASTLKVAIPNDITGREVDPALTAGGTAIPFLYSLYEPLYEFDDEGVPQPNVAASDELSANGLTLTLTLQEGLTFHDGSPLDAEDVVFSLDRARGADEALDGPTSTSSLSSIESVEMADAATVTIHLSSPDPVLRNSLAYLGGMVLPSDYIEEVGNDGFLQHPIGSGPYEFASATQGQQIKLTAFGDYAFEPAASYTNIELQVLEEGATRIAQLRSGDIDFALDVDISQIEELENGGFTVTTNPSGQVLSILFNSQTEAFDDARVRRALNLAVNVEAIVENIYLGRASIVPSNDPTLTAGDVDPLGYDPDRARELLEDAGYDESESLVMNYPSGRYPQDQRLMQTVQADLAAVGVTVELQPVDSNQWLEGLRNKTLDDMTLTLNANVNYDPYQTLSAGLSCDGPWSLWCDDEFDSQLAEIEGLMDQERRDGFTEISEGFSENPLAIYLLDYHQIYAMQEGIEWNPTPGIRNYDYTDIRPAS